MYVFVEFQSMIIINFVWQNALNETHLSIAYYDDKCTIHGSSGFWMPRMHTYTNFIIMRTDKNAMKFMTDVQRATYNVSHYTFFFYVAFFFFSAPIPWNRFCSSSLVILLIFFLLSIRSAEPREADYVCRVFVYLGYKLWICLCRLPYYDILDALFFILSIWSPYASVKQCIQRCFMRFSS